MYTAIAWRDETQFDLGAMATRRPDRAGEDFISGEDMLALARVAFAGMISLFGSARAVMLAAFLSRIDWFDLDCWLQHIEKLTRRGLMMLALNIARPQGSAPQRARKPTKKPAEEKRKVYTPRRARGFQVLRPHRKPGPRGKKHDKPHDPVGALRDHKSTLSIALRIEALMRALNSPEEVARRLALKLERMDRPHSIPTPRPPRDEFDLTGRGAPPRAVMSLLEASLKPLERRVRDYFQPP